MKLPTTSTGERETDRDFYLCNGSDPDEIVITGMAGRLPQSANIGEFKDLLYNKVDQKLSTDRCDFKLFEDASFIAVLNTLEEFDAKFFDVSEKDAQLMDPGLRILHEVCYEAILDAGYTVEEVKKGRVGVYSAINEVDSQQVMQQTDYFDHRAVQGSILSCYASRVSYAFGFTGPSYIMDSGCASFLSGMTKAFHDVRTGRCDAALVIGSHIQINRFTKTSNRVLQWNNNFMRPFDVDSNGFSIGEAVGAIILQKASKARRVYAIVKGAYAVNMGYNANGVYTVNAASQVESMENFFKSFPSLNTKEVTFAELHGTATDIGDVAETEAVAAVLCQNRDGPLYIGAVKSNVGHTEACSGFASIAKIIISLEYGLMAPNIAYESPNPKLTKVVDGTLKVVVEPTEWDGLGAIVNNFGIGGVLGHVLLSSNPLTKKPNKTCDVSLPRLILHSSPTEEGLTTLFEYLKENPSQEELYYLLDKISPTSKANPFRGFTVLNGKSPGYVVEKVKTYKRRPVYYVCSSMGCQWPGMGLDMLKFEVFAKSMKKSAEILKPLGINLFQILNASSDAFTKNRCITPCFVAITSIQIALIDLLRSMGLEPDGIVGHSTGEMACAYADGCCTAEETILLSYYRGKAVDSGKLAYGKMAAIGLTWEEAVKRCPEDVYPVAENTSDSVTISGPTQRTSKFLQELKSENVFSVTVNCCGYAFHSCHVAPVAPQLLEYLKKVLPTPRKMSSRWINTAYSPEERRTLKDRVADANYFVHNFVSPVRFYGALLEIPKDSIIIEIGPNAMFSTTLKKGVGPEIDFIPLMDQATNNVEYFLNSIGRLYTIGLNPLVANLYPPAKFPVPRGTPSISDFMRWDHSKKWHILKSEKQNTVIDVFCDNAKFIIDHQVRGKNFFPATGFLVAIWQMFAVSLQKTVFETPVIFEDVKLHDAIILFRGVHTALNLSILPGSGKFELHESETLCITGRVYSPTSTAWATDVPQYTKGATFAISGEEVYDLLKISNFHYGPEFQCLSEINFDCTQGIIKWNDNWVTFLDAMLIAIAMSANSRSVALPTGLDSVKINPKAFQAYVEKNNCSETGVPFHIDKNTSKIMAPGVELCSLHLHPLAEEPIEEVPTHEVHDFVPYIEDVSATQKDILEAYNQLCMAEAQIMMQLSDPTISPTPNEKLPTLDIDSIPEASRVLLAALQYVSEQLKQGATAKSLKQVFCNYLKKIHNDVLISVALTDVAIRSVFDIIEENLPKQSYNAIEICDGVYPFSFSIASALKSSTIKTWNFAVAHKSPMLVSNQSQDVKVEQVKSIIHLESKVKDVLICSCFHGDEDSIRSFVNQIVTINADGFFVVLYRASISQAEIAMQTVCDCYLEVQPTSLFEDILLDENLCVVAKKSLSEGMFLYLLRICAFDSSRIVCKMQGTFEDWVPTLQQALKDVVDKSNATIWVVSENDRYSGTLGFMNCLKNELDGEKVRYIFNCDPTPIPAFDENDPFYAEVLTKSIFANVYKNGVWGSYRRSLIKYGFPKKLSQYCQLFVSELTNFSSVRWRQAPFPYQLQYQPKELKNIKRMQCHVYYAALNFRDVVLPSGKRVVGDQNVKFRENASFGLEFSGRNLEGQRMCGFADSSNMVWKSSGRVVEEVEPNAPDGLEFAGEVVDGKRKCGFTDFAISNMVWTSDLLSWPVPDGWPLEKAATVCTVYYTCYYFLIMRGKLKAGEKVLIHCGSGGIGQSAIHIAKSLDCEIFTTVGTHRKKEYILEKFPWFKPENIGQSMNDTFYGMIMSQTKGKGVDIVINSLTEDKLGSGISCLAPHGRFVEIGMHDRFANNKLALELLAENKQFLPICIDKLTPQMCLREMMEVHRLVSDGIANGVVQPLDTTLFDVDHVEEAIRFMTARKHMGKVVIKIRDEEEDRNFVPEPLVLNALATTFFYWHKSYIIIGGLGGIGFAMAEWMIERGASKIILTSRKGLVQVSQRHSLERWQRKGCQIVVSQLNAANEEDAKNLLALAVEMGPVGGIFNSSLVLIDEMFPNQTPLNFRNVCAPKVDATKCFDKLTRAHCPQLDWFVCFSSLSCSRGMPSQTNYAYANSVMERICEERKKDGLPGLAVEWGLVGDVGFVHRNKISLLKDVIVAQKIKSCMASLDIFMQLDYAVVGSCMTSSMTTTTLDIDKVCEQMSKILGIYMGASNLDKTMTELGLDSMASIEASSIIEKSCNLSIPANVLRDMTVNEIRDFIKLQNKVSATNDSQVSCDAIFHRTTVLPLNNVIAGTPLFIVSPTNCASDLKILAELIQVPVYALQLTENVLDLNIDKLADFYLEEISQRFPEDSVHLAGFSYCSLVALEMANKQTRHTSDLVLILDGYNWLEHAINKGSSLDFIAIANNLINDSVTHWIGSEIVELKEELLALSSEERRVDYAANLVHNLYSNRGFGKDTISKAIQRDCTFLKLVKEYTIESKIQSSVLMLENRDNVEAKSKQAMKSTLEKVCSGDIDIFPIDAYVTTFVDASNCQDIARVIESILKA